MKLKNTEHNAVVHSQNAAMQFSIESSVKAFEIISQTIYTNAIKAVARELLCNAWDSHQLSRNYNKCIDCHLPTRFEPYLIIRDYGVGMTPEHIKNVYTVAFKSSKEHDEKQTGALGLGSKTPFAYDKEQAFSVTTWVDGIKYIYSVYMDKGTPQCVLLSQTPSDDPTGVEIKIEIKSEDFDAFQRAAVLSSYTMKNPSVDFNLDVQLPVATYESELYSTYNMHTGGRCISAEMCNVVYPINKNELKNQDLYYTLASLLPYSESPHMLIHFDSGELKFQASREQLYYDNEYIDIIESKIQSVIDAFIENAQKSIDNLEYTDWKLVYHYAKSKYNNEVVDNLTFENKLFSDYVREIAYRNRDISENLGAMDECAIRYHLSNNGVRRIKFLNNYRRTEYPDRFLPTTEKTGHCFFINDMGNKGSKFIRKFMEHHNIKFLWYIDEQNYPKKSRFGKELLKILDPDEIYIKGTASQIQDEDYIKTKKRRKAVQIRKPINVFKYTDSNGKKGTSCTPEFLKTGSYIYTGYYRDYCDNDGKKLSVELLGRDIHSDSSLLCYVSKFLGQPIYAIRRAKLRYPKNNPNAINILEKIQEIRNSVDFESVMCTITKTRNVYSGHISGSHGCVKLLSAFGLIKESPVFASNIECNLVGADKDLAQKYNMYVAELDNKYKEMLKAYPLVTKLNAVEDIKEYMSLVDYKNSHQGNSND